MLLSKKIFIRIECFIFAGCFKDDGIQAYEWILFTVVYGKRENISDHCQVGYNMRSSLSFQSCLNKKKLFTFVSNILLLKYCSNIKHLGC